MPGERLGESAIEEARACLWRRPYMEEASGRRVDGGVLCLEVGGGGAWP